MDNQTLQLTRGIAIRRSRQSSYVHVLSANSTTGPQPLESSGRLAMLQSLDLCAVQNRPPFRYHMYESPAPTRRAQPRNLQAEVKKSEEKKKKNPQKQGKTKPITYCKQLLSYVLKLGLRGWSTHTNNLQHMNNNNNKPH